MSTTYTIRIVNNSNETNNFFVFTDIPKVNPAPSSKTFVNAWSSFPAIPSSGQARIEYTKNYSSYWGTIPEEVAPGEIVSTGQTLPVTLGKSLFNFTSTPPSFTEVDQTTPPGSYVIKTTGDFTIPNKLVFGIALTDQDGVSSPVATFGAQPSSSFTIYPVSKFYVATGSYIAGSIIDVQTIGNASTAIDFTGRLETTAVVILKPDMTYDIKYFLNSNRLGNPVLVATVVLSLTTSALAMTVCKAINDGKYVTFTVKAKVIGTDIQVEVNKPGADNGPGYLAYDEAVRLISPSFADALEKSNTTAKIAWNPFS